MPLIDYIPSQTNIGFMKLRRYSFPFSAVLSLVAVILFGAVGFNLGIDFRGGTLIEAQSSREAADLSVLFVSKACADAGEDRLPTRRRRVAVRDCRDVDLHRMAHHGRTGEVTVDPRTAQVRLDGEVVTSSAQERVSLSRLYLL